MSSAKAASDNLPGFPRRHTVYCFLSVFTLHPVGKRSIAITKLCMSACISVFARLSGKYPSNLHQICYARYLQPWFGPPLTASRYVIYLRLMDDVLYFCTVMARNRHILKMAHRGAARIWHRNEYPHWPTRGQHRTVGGIWYLRLPCFRY